MSGSPEKAMKALARTDAKAMFEICFFVIGGENFVRLKGDRGIYQVMKQVQYRCGMCGQIVQETEFDRHANKHQAEMRE